MKILLTLLLGSLLFTSCERKCDCVVPYESYYFKGVVVNTSMSACSLPLIDFTEDSTRIRQLTGMDNFFCIAKGLDPTCNVQGKKIYADVYALKPAEDFSCPTSNDFPHVGIRDTKSR